MQRNADQIMALGGYALTPQATRFVIIAVRHYIEALTASEDPDGNIIGYYQSLLAGMVEQVDTSGDA